MKTLRERDPDAPVQARTDVDLGDIVRVVKATCEDLGIKESLRTQLIKGVNTLRMTGLPVAIGSYEYPDGAKCPVNLAGYYDPETRNIYPDAPLELIEFTRHFDERMRCKLYGDDWELREI